MVKFGCSHFAVQNEDMGTVLKRIAYFSQIENASIPIVDETGIGYNIDLTLEFIPFDFDSVKRALEKKGLDIVQGEKEMDVLVIRD